MNRGLSVSSISALLVYFALYGGLLPSVQCQSADELVEVSDALDAELAKRGGARAFQSADAFDSEKRAGGRNFQFLSGSSDKRAGGRNFQSSYDPEKRGGARPFASEKRAGGRGFAAVPADTDLAFDKRGGARPFYMGQSWKRGGGRAFSFADDFEKRAGGRAFQLNKRGGGRAFNGGGNRFRSFYGGGGSYLLPYEKKNYGDSLYYYLSGPSPKRAGARPFADAYAPEQWMDKRAGGRTFPIMGDSMEKRIFEENAGSR